MCKIRSKISLISALGIRIASKDRAAVAVKALPSNDVGGQGHWSASSQEIRLFATAALSTAPLPADILKRSWTLKDPRWSVSRHEHFIPISGSFGSTIWEKEPEGMEDAVCE